MNQNQLLMVALKAEEAAILPLIKVEQRHTYQGAVLHVGKIAEHSVLLLRCGIGPIRSEFAMNWILQNYSFAEAIFTGFGGGLDPKLKRGTALIAEQVVLGYEQDAKILNCHVELNQKITQNIHSSDIIYQTGRLLTVRDPLLTTKQKENALMEWQAHVVDMESYPALNKLSEQQIPFSAIRFVLDDSEDNLMDFDGVMTASGEINPRGLVKKVMQQPSIITHMPKLGMYTNEVSQKIKSFYKKYFNLNKY